MKPAFRHITLFTAFIALFSVSCNKSEPLTTPTDILVGKWRLAEIATDDNNNRVLDQNEIKPEDPNDLTTFSFHYGGQGVEERNYYGVITDYYFTWQILGGSQYLQRFMEGHDTITQKILTFSPAKTTLLDTTGIYVWYILQKY